MESKGMFVEILHENGKIYQMPVTQVTVFADDGQPCALAYQTAGLIVHNSASSKDFDAACRQLQIKRIEVEHPDGGR